MECMDDVLAYLPDEDLLAPRACWLAKDFFSTAFMIIRPSRLWRTVKKAMDNIDSALYDMDLLNRILGDTATTLSGEYVTLYSHWGPGHFQISTLQ